MMTGAAPEIINANMYFDIAYIFYSACQLFSIKSRAYRLLEASSSKILGLGSFWL